MAAGLFDGVLDNGGLKEAFSLGLRNALSSIQQRLARAALKYVRRFSDGRPLLRVLSLLESQPTPRSML